MAAHRPLPVALSNPVAFLLGERPGDPEHAFGLAVRAHGDTVVFASLMAAVAGLLGGGALEAAGPDGHTVDVDDAMVVETLAAVGFSPDPALLYAVLASARQPEDHRFDEMLHAAQGSFHAVLVVLFEVFTALVGAMAADARVSAARMARRVLESVESAAA